MLPAIPKIEIAYNLNRLSIRGPYSEVNSYFAIDRSAMCSKASIDVPISAFTEKVSIEIGH
jgi:hypothetical protein